MTRLRAWSAFAVICLLASSTVRGEERICRYCADTNALPVGTDLEGRYHFAPDRQVDVLHIKLDVTPNFEKQTVSGRASITAKPIAGPCDMLRLDAIHLKVDKVTCEGAEVLDFVSSREDLRIAFAEPIPVGTSFTIHVDYHAQPTKGLYFRTPAMGYPATDSHIWTQGETHEARHWFPCFDYPNERSSTEIICHVPKDMTVLSNGAHMGEEQEPGGMKAVRWLQSKPHVNYLICLVAGHLEKLEKRHRDVPLAFYTQPTLAKHAKNSFEDTPAIMAFFEDEIGVPFPWNKYDQVTIRDFTAGGMENTTLTTLTHRTIFSSKTENLRTTRRLDAHEMAHQWFGDYVTCKDWSHLWLNEGFATYYTHLYEGHKYGRDAMLYGLSRDARGILGRKSDKRPIVFNEYKNPMEQFDYRSYPKGSWVLHMLRSQLGEDLYRACIKAYLKKHALTSVVSDDLRQVIEDISGRTMDRFFNQWLYHARHPDLRISYRWQPKTKLARVTIRQTQKVDDDVVLFELPTKLRFVVQGKSLDHDIVVDKVTEDFYVALPGKPSIVRFDPDYTLLADVSFDKSDDLWHAQIENQDDMMGRLRAAEALGARKTHASVEKLEKALKTDPFHGVRIAAAQALAKHESDESYEVLRELWQQDDARVRSAMVGHLVGRLHDTTPGIIRKILAVEKNPAILAKAVRALGRFPGENATEVVRKHLHSDSFRNELAIAAIAAMREQNDPSHAKLLLKTLKNRADEFESGGLGQGLDALAHLSKSQRKKKNVREFLVSFVNHPKTNVRTAAIRALGTLGDEKAISALSALSDSNDTRIAQAAKDAVRRLREVKPSAPREVIDLRKQVADVQKANDKINEELKEIRKQLEAATAKPAAEPEKKAESDE